MRTRARRTGIRTTVAALAAWMALAAPATAPASTFQVASPAAGGGSDVTCAPCATIQGAVAAAAASPGADVVEVPAGTFDELVDIAVGNVVDVRGAGDATVLRNTSIAPSTFVLTMHDGAVRGMRIQDAGDAVLMYGGTLAGVRVQVTSDPAPFRAAVSLESGEGGGQVVRSAVIEVPIGSSANYGITSSADGVRPLVDDVHLTAGYAIQVSGAAGMGVRRSTLRGAFFGLLARNLAGPVDVQSSAIFAQVLPVAGGGGRGVGVTATSGSPSVTLRSSTVVGTGASADPNGSAVYVSAASSGTARLVVTDTAVVRWAQDAEIEGVASSLRVIRSMFRTAAVLLQGGAAAPTALAAFSTTTPGFRDLAAEDVRLRPTSPLIERGRAAPLGASSMPGLFARDWRDARRLTKFTASSSTPARLDIGAVEFQPAPRALTDVDLVGGTRVGQVARCVRVERWLGDVASRRIRWYRSGVLIPGESGTTYTIRPADRGTSLRCSEMATSRDGASSTHRSFHVLAIT